MGVSPTLHRLSAAGMVVFAVAYLIFIFLSDGNGPRLRLAAMMLIHGAEGAWMVWGLIIATTTAALFLRRRHPSSISFFAGLLFLGTLAWVGAHIIYVSLAFPNGEYWGYYLDFLMVRWMLAPWFAQYSVTLFIACLAIWAITRRTPIGSRAVY